MYLPFDSGYCIDSSALIELGRRDIFDRSSPYLTEFEGFIEKGFLVATEEVFDEITAGNDKLAEWAKKNKNLFEELNSNTFALAREIASQNPQIINFMKTNDDADVFIVALAKERRWAVVTCEKRFRTNNSPKIPDICDKYGIECISLLDFLEKEKLVNLHRLLSS
jgi:hypothetical protein